MYEGLQETNITFHTLGKFQQRLMRHLLFESFFTLSQFQVLVLAFEYYRILQRGLIRRIIRADSF